MLAVATRQVARPVEPLQRNWASRGMPEGLKLVTRTQPPKAVRVFQATALLLRHLFQSSVDGWSAKVGVLCACRLIACSTLAGSILGIALALHGVLTIEKRCIIAKNLGIDRRKQQRCIPARLTDRLHIAKAL